MENQYNNYEQSYTDENNQYTDQTKQIADDGIFNHYGIIDKGIIPTLNEDNMDGFTLLNNSVICLCVADGLGSVYGGQISSVVAIKELQMFLEKFLIYDDTESMKYCLYQGIYMVNRIIGNYQRLNPELYGNFTSTLTVVLINQNRNVVIGHIGNSRLYLIREGNIYQITDDDTVAYSLLQENKITREEYRIHPDRNRLTKFLGDVSCEPLVIDDKLQKEDLILLCTNGIFEMLNDAQILEIIQQTGNSKDACESLIANANELGGIDNEAVLISYIDF